MNIASGLKQNIFLELSLMLHHENQLVLTGTTCTGDELLARIITNGLLLIPYHDSPQQLFVKAMASVSTVFRRLLLQERT